MGALQQQGATRGGDDRCSIAIKEGGGGERDKKGVLLVVVNAPGIFAHEFRYHLIEGVRRFTVVIM